MATLAQLRSRIADDLDRDDMSTQIDKAVNRAISHYGMSRFWFNEATGTFSTVASQENYGTGDGIPSDILEVDYLTVTSGSDKLEVEQRDYKFLQQINPDAGTGLPIYFAWFQENIYFYPVPDAVYTITVSYLQNYSDLSADGDSNDFSNNADELIENYSLRWIYSRVLKDPEQALIANQLEQSAFSSLQAKTTNLISDGSLRPTEF